MPKRLERPFAKKSHPFFWCTFFWCDLSLSPLSVQSPFGVQCSTLTARAKPEFHAKSHLFQSQREGRVEVDSKLVDSELQMNFEKNHKV